MKIDLVGPSMRGLAMGLNEAAGYAAVAVTAYLTGYLAERYGLRPQPFFLGLACAGLGLGLSALFVRETRGHARAEGAASTDPRAGPTLSADRTGRKPMIVLGLFVQALALAEIATTRGFGWWAAGAAALGVGTAMVYPTLLAAIGDVAHPGWRASAIGVYRLWRDLGFAVGALLSGVAADLFGMGTAIWLVAALTALSGGVVAVRMYETRRGPAASPTS